MTSLSIRIMRRVRGHGRGNRVYTPRDFLDQGSRAAVDQALGRLVKSGQLRRISRGLYDYPRTSRVLDRLVPPRADDVAAAVAGRNAKILPDGIATANALGLTTAVPAKASFVTNGHTGDIHVGGRTIHLNKVSRKLMPWMGRPGAAVVQALDWLGPMAADDQRIVTILRARLPDYVKNDLRRGICDVSGWAQPIIGQVVAKEQMLA